MTRGDGRYPVSIKAVLVIAGRIALLKNARDEWELPGGRLEAGEQPPHALLREIAEELAVEAADPEIIDSWLYDIAGKGPVLIVTYGCRFVGGTARVSDEHSELGLFAPEQIAGLTMPEGYKRSIRIWLDRLAERDIGIAGCA